MPGIDDSRQFIPLKIAVLSISDTRALADDKSGATLVERAGFKLIHRETHDTFGKKLIGETWELDLRSQ